MDIDNDIEVRQIPLDEENIANEEFHLAPKDDPFPQSKPQSALEILNSARSV